MSQFIVRSPYPLPDDYDVQTKKSITSYTMENFLQCDVVNKVALLDGASGLSKTYGQLHSDTHKFAHSLQDMGFKQGDCIGIMSPNHVHYFTSFQGIALFGAASTPIVCNVIILSEAGPYLTLHY
jgi:long-subunit acyl-CoA synthetase (AMP-forming)